MFSILLVEVTMHRAVILMLYGIANFWLCLEVIAHGMLSPVAEKVLDQNAADLVKDLLGLS